VPWDPWTLTGLTDGASVLLNWLHPAIPLDPPPGWLVSLVYGLAPLAAVFAWHLFLEYLTQRHHQDDEPTGENGAVQPDAEQGPGTGPGSRRAARGRARPVRWRDPAGPGDRPAGPGHDRAVALPRLCRLRELRAEAPSRNGAAPALGRRDAGSDAGAGAP
jgi:hypothetical protein